MLKILIINYESAEMNRLLSDVPWPGLGFEAVPVSGNTRLLDQKEILQSASAAIIHIRNTEDLNTVSIIRKAEPRIHLLLTHEDWPFELLKSALKIGAEYYLTSPVNIDELFEAIQHIGSLCIEEQETTRLQKSILAAGVAQRLDGYNASLPAQINLDDLTAAYFDIDTPQSNVLYYLAFVSIGEYRYIIQNQEILDFTIADVNKSVQQIGSVSQSMLIQLSQQDFVLISPLEMESSLKSWWVQEQETKEFITIIYEKKPLSPSSFQEKIRELRILKNNFVLSNGSGKLYETQEAEACTGIIPPAKVFAFDLTQMIQALMQGNESVVQQELARFFSENICHNIHMLTVELVEQIDRELASQSIHPPFSSKRKSMLIKRLLDVESARMLHHMMQAYLDDLMTSLTSTENKYHDRIVHAAIAYIQQHCNEPFTIEQLAETLHYSPNHLRYVFKNSTGHTLSEEITTIRMNQARRLLEETTLRVHEISQQVGYTNPSYFISQFYKKFGSTPVQYRQRMRS